MPLAGMTGAPSVEPLGRYFCLFPVAPRERLTQTFGVRAVNSERLKMRAVLAEKLWERLFDQKLIVLAIKPSP